MSEYDIEARYRRLTKLAKGERQYTDTSNAERFLKAHGEEVRYCRPWKRWLCWDGIRWREEGDEMVQALAKRIIRQMYVEANRLDDDRDRYELECHAIKSEAVRRRKAMIEAASWEPAAWVDPEDLDRNEWLFNCRNCTVDLRTGRVRPQERRDFVTRVAKVDYCQGADCPRWRRFLAEITGGNEDLVAFIAKAAGWALSGDMSEQTMFILYGNGANGKSTFLNTLLELMGDYGISTPTETFMRRPGERISNDIARLRGTRLVTSVEAEEGRRLSEPLVKQITGNDRMTARFLYGEYFEFQPTFKIFLATNHKPVISGTDYAIWRRIRLIPFTVMIPPASQDTHLAAKLREEFPGILNWLVEGCLRWQAEGLGEPPAVKQATERYRKEMDVIGSFLGERCAVEEGQSTKSRELFKAYAAWCEENRESAGSERLLAFRLEEMGFTKRKRMDAHYWIGLGLRNGGPNP